MDNKKYLDEEQYQRSAKKLSKIGMIVLIVGLVMLVLGVIFLILGFAGFGKTGVGIASDFDSGQTAKGIFGGFGLFALGGFLNSFGGFTTIVGGIIMFVAHRREITAFTTQQVMPVAKEGIEEIAPTIGNAAGEIAKGIKKGINEANKEDE